MDLLYNSSSCNREGYINMFEEVEKHKFGPLKLVTKDYKPPSYLHKHKRHTKEVWKSALKSDRVQWIVSQVVRNENRSKEEVLTEAEAILKELAYTDHMSLVRIFGYILYYVQKTIYSDGVFINMEAVEKIRSVILHHPVVFMPSHRSYMDFLMLSLVCYFVDLPLPAIAAGMDFKSMAIISTFLRSSGAFFMRRSFGSDRLYWSLFTEYVHTILINGDRPMEFFIEGTRSRVGKSLNPKFGLLSVISEPYLKAQTYDVVIVPVSISYDRLLEEKLYAYELLGVPKPKESTSGVFKAASILKENYGSVHCHFGEAISLREYFGSHLNRAVHACYPRYMLNLSSEEQRSMKVLAYKLVRKQQENMICSPFTVIAAILCLHPDGINLSKLVAEVVWLRGVLHKFGVRFFWPIGHINEVILNYLRRYQHIVNSVDVNGQSDLSSDLWISIPINVTTSPKKKTQRILDQKLQDDAASHLMVANYRNQLLCYLIRPALVAFCLQKLSYDGNANGTFTIEFCEPGFSFLQQLLQKEFVFEPDEVIADLQEGIDVLIKCGAVTRKNGNTYHVESHSDRLLGFLCAMFSSFLISYWLCCQYLLGSGGIHDHDKVGSQIQQWIAGHVSDNGVQYEMLSLNLISNAVHSLMRMSALIVSKTRSQKLLEPLHSKLLQISVQLSSFVHMPNVNGISALSGINSNTSKL